VLFSRDRGNWQQKPDGFSAVPTSPQDIFLNQLPTMTEAVLAYTALTDGVGWHNFPSDVFKKDPAFNPLLALAQRGLSPIQRSLNDDATNYLEIIKALTQDLRNQNSRRQILARLKKINPSVKSIEINSIQQPSTVIVTHRFNEQEIPLQLSQESDGFRRYYAH